MINKSAVKLIADSEGLRLKPYYDPSGIATIGYGNTYYEDGSRVKITDKAISKERALSLFGNVVNHFAVKVKPMVKVSLNPNQFGALVSLAYNIGLGAFGKSTVLKLVNSGEFGEPLKVSFDSFNQSKGVVLNGLKIRRKKEYELFKKPDLLGVLMIPLLLFFYTVFTVAL
jgi:lysozyme